MKALPMIFNTEMVQALMDGRKIQTRRPVKLQPFYSTSFIPSWVFPRNKSDIEAGDSGLLYPNAISKVLALSGYSVGDLIWVRERMRVHAINGQIGAGVIAASVKYVADGDQSEIISWPERLKEKPVLGKCLSNSGPREFSRITLKVTSVRVERVQDISRNDCIAEGFQGGHGSIPGYMYSATPKEHFSETWKQIYSDHWDNNGWCWVIDFEVILKNVDTVISEMED